MKTCVEVSSSFKHPLLSGSSATKPDGGHLSLCWSVSCPRWQLRCSKTIAWPWPPQNVSSCSLRPQQMVWGTIQTSSLPGTSESPGGYYFSTRICFCIPPPAGNAWIAALLSELDILSNLETGQQSSSPQDKSAKIYPFPELASDLIRWVSELTKLLL